MMASPAYIQRYGLNFVAALTAADAAFTAVSFLDLLLTNIPKWHGLPLLIIASDLVMFMVFFAIQWPVILVLSAVPSLIAYLIQMWTQITAFYIFVILGSAIGLICSWGAYITVFSWLYNDSGEPREPVYYLSHSGLYAAIAGGIGGWIYRRVAFERSPRLR